MITSGGYEGSLLNSIHTNHPRSETSTYLLQHVHNPVDWYLQSRSRLEYQAAWKSASGRAGERGGARAGKPRCVSILLAARVAYARMC